MAEEVDDTAVKSLVVSVVTVGTLAISLFLLAVGFELFWLTLMLGFAGVLPVALTAVENYERETNSTEELSDREQSLERLKRKYVKGEISEAEFDRRVEKLVKTETVSDAEAYVQQTDNEQVEFETE